VPSRRPRQRICDDCPRVNRAIAGYSLGKTPCLVSKVLTTDSTPAQSHRGFGLIRTRGLCYHMKQMSIGKKPQGYKSRERR